jgi:release factor glutamine methyltransferase
MVGSEVEGARTSASALHDGASRLERAGIDDARLEADVLLRHALGIDDDRAALLARLHERIDDEAAARFEALLQRRLAHEPAAYIVGYREFYGLRIACTPDALIPRPETEMLADIALDRLGRSELSGPLVVDVGTGTGALAIAVAAHCARARVIATDASLATLGLARRNAGVHGVLDRVALVAGDLLAPLRASPDVVVANLPYVAEADWRALPPEIREHEPPTALVGGPTGTEIIERLLAQAASLMCPGSLLLCECGADQGDALRSAAARAFGDARADVRRDLAGLDRVLCVERG